MLKKSVLIKSTERNYWRVLRQEGYSDLYFDNIVLAEMQRMYLQYRNRIYMQIDQLKVIECKREMIVTGIFQICRESRVKMSKQ